MLRRVVLTLAQGLSRSAFVLSLALLAFAVGFLVRGNKWFPYLPVTDALKTLVTIRDQMTMPFAANQFLGFNGGDIAGIAANRIIARSPAPASAGDEHFLMSGGIYQFLEYCPGDGCIAAEFTRAGALVHAYPYRPDQFAAHQIVSLPYEQPLFDFAKDMYPFGMLKLPGGDLIVIFNQWNSFPYGGGVARVRPDGSVAWFRHDYSHHWPRLLPDGNIAVPATRIGPSRVSTPLTQGLNIDLNCSGKIMEDVIRILNPAGRLQQEVSVFDAFLRSPYRGMLIDTPDDCDPLHVNYVMPVTAGIRSLYNDVAPDDLVISLRSLSAFAILGRRDARVKHLFTGTFRRQHDVHPLGQSATMLIFDNHGADWLAGPSRLLAYDLADHAEHTLLPNPNAPNVKMFSDTAGDISVSPDGSRAIVASSLEGRGYEIRIADGKILTIFNDIHDVSKVPAAGGSRAREAARFALYNLQYVH